MRWVIKAHDVSMLCFYHVGDVVYGLWLWCLWWPRYVIVVRSCKCPPIGAIHLDLVILGRLQCFVIGLSSYDGFYDDLAMFKVKVVEEWQIYIQCHDLTLRITIWPRHDENYAYLKNLWAIGSFLYDLVFSWHTRKLLKSNNGILIFKVWFHIFFVAFVPVKDDDEKNYVVWWTLGWEIWTLVLWNHV